MSDEELTDEDLFYRGFLEDSPLESPNEDQVQARIKSYLDRLYLFEKRELEKFNLALDHSLLEIRELKDIVINERLADLESANEFSWLGLLLSVVVLPFAGAAVAAVASIALHRILRNRLLFAKLTSKLKINEPLSSKQKQSLLDMENFKYSFENGKIKVKLKQTQNFLVNPDSIEAKVFTELPDIVKDMFDNSVASVPSSSSVKPKKRAKTQVRFADVVLDLRLKFKADVTSLDMRHNKFMETLDYQFNSNDSLPFVKDLAKVIYTHISEDPIQSLKVQPISDTDHIKLLSQNIFAHLLMFSNIPVPVEIKPEQRVTQAIRDPGFKPTYTFVTDKIIPEHVIANKTQKAVLNELGHIFLVPNELRQNRVVSYADKYPDDQRTRHIEVVKLFGTLIKRSRLTTPR